MDTATARYEEQLDLAIRFGDRVAEADAHFNLMFAHRLHMNAPAATAELEAALTLFEELGDAQGVARITWARATSLMSGGNPQAALPLFLEATESFERIGDVWYYAMGTGSLSWCYFALDQPQEATRWVVRTVVRYHTLRDATTTTISLATAARIALEAGLPEDAAMLLGAFENLSEVYGVKPPSGILHIITGAKVEEHIREALDPDEFAEAVDRGRRLTLDEAVAMVVASSQVIVGDRVAAQ